MTQSTGGGTVGGTVVGITVGARVGHEWVLHGLLCTLVAGSGQGAPRLAEATFTVRTDCNQPPPQGAEQMPTGTNALMTQSTFRVGGAVGHAWVLHASVRVLVATSGQAFPPFAGVMATVRTINCEPVPQEAEHDPTASNEVMTQSTGAEVGAKVGQAWVLQGSVLLLSAMAGHALPPFADGVTTELISCCTPPPQEAEHEPTTLKPDMAQSTGAGGGTVGGGVRVGTVVGATVGHACVLQASVLLLSVRAGHALPP